MIATDIAVVRIDHGVVPTNDLGRSLSFCTNVLGAHFNALVNVNLRGLNREVPEMAFVTLAHHRGFGIALQDQPMPAPIRPTDGPVWGFEVDERGIEGVMAALAAKGVPLEGPVEYPAPSPIAAAVLVRDPFECAYELVVRRDGVAEPAGQGDLGLRRISHVRLEVTDLDLAARWYTETLGLQPSAAVPGDRQQTWRVGASGQLFILREVDRLTPRSHYSRGPHVDVKVPIGAYEAFLPRLTNVERYWGPHGDQIPWHEPDTRTIYFYDPFGNRFQVGEDRPHP